MKLKDKVALITGAASGMGRAQAELFAKEGAKVIAADINLEGVTEVAEKISADGGEVLPVKVDVSSADEIKEMVQKGLERFGQIDVLSNTAGILDDYAPTLETSEELWDRIFTINLKGMFLITNEVLPQMIERGKGTVINIASIAGFVAGGGGAAYTAAKHGVIGYTKQLSFDYGRKGIRANAIAPGAIETGMTKDILKDGNREVMEAVRSVPAGRHGQPEEVAHLALFLASDDSAFIHGAVIPIDGGWIVR